ncbi:unnamed protein product [Choristocarpus tenellus]
MGAEHHKATTNCNIFSYRRYDATRDLSTKAVSINYTNCNGQDLMCPGSEIAESVSVVPILRGGLGMSEVFLELLPNAPMYHIGMYRNPGSMIPVQYYNRLPKGHPSDVALVLDPIIASSRTICAVVSIVKKWGARKVKVVTLVASKCGILALTNQHPDVEVHVASIDTLAENGLDLVPGIGDAGDRLYLGLNSEESRDTNYNKMPLTDTDQSENVEGKKLRIS